MKHVAISLLNYNGKKNTLDCLESLKKIKTDNFKLTIIIVDNASIDGSQEVLSKAVAENSNIKVILNKKNLGFSGGHNMAIRHALSENIDYVLILNNDTHVDPNFLIELLKTAEKASGAGIFSPKIYFAPGFEFRKDKYSKNEIGKVFWYAGGMMDWKNIIGYHRGVDEVDEGQYGKVEETELATGCCMLIKRGVFEKIGYLDEKYFLYYEDADFNIKAKKSGYRIMYVPPSVIWHKNAGSVGGSGSSIQDYYITRNRLLFGTKFASFRTRLALVKESLILLLKGRRWQRRGIIDFYLGNFGKGSYKV